MGARFQVVETPGQKLTYQQASTAAALLTHNGTNGRLAVLNTQEKYNTAIATLEEYLSRTDRPSRSDHLFLTTIPPYKEAAKATIKR